MAFLSNAAKLGSPRRVRKNAPTEQNRVVDENTMGWMSEKKGSEKSGAALPSGGSTPRTRPEDPATAPPRARLHQIADSHQVVDRHREGEHPAHPGQLFVPALAHQAHRFYPAEDLLHPLALPLAHRVAHMTGASIDDAARPGVLSHVGRDLQFPDPPQSCTTF